MKFICTWAIVIQLVHVGGDDACEAPPVDAKYASDPPGYFPMDFLEVPVKAVREVTHDAKVITFALPTGVSLNLPVSSAILMRAPKYDNGKDVIRPYNPISSNQVLGSFDLLIKVYPEGKGSAFAQSLQPGDRVAFKQVKANVKPFQYPFARQTITMLAGGTGIAPMLQALHPIFETPGDRTRVRLLYGNKTPLDIMLKDELDALAQKHADRFDVHYVVGTSADDSTAAGLGYETGWIDEEKVKRLGFPPGKDTAVWVCGLDAMYESLAGSRHKPLKPGSILHNLGYSNDMIWRS